MEEEKILAIDYLATTPVTAKDKRLKARRDPWMSRVLRYTLEGWPTTVDNELLPYWRRHEELSVREVCVLWCDRVIIPRVERPAIIAELHFGHPGMTKMKAVARSYLWWPGMDKNLEGTVRACERCQQRVKAPPRALLHPQLLPKRLWSRIHVDYAGSFMGRMFLVTVDAFSKWLDVYATQSATTEVTSEKRKTSFAIHGIPERLVSDNGTCFTSSEFRTFCESQGIIHTKSTPYHPSSNRLAERAVQTFKDGSRKLETRSLNETLQTFC
ncbi:uncharacterized protein K02A2.6-like [Corticium candelabrum]|uniref:uncharacterized protein K02A2.6-like n=1 Tax=Corticium candelabrum TaxID=121492 RepID=UPI002E3094A8|nr:uncharacterized protein K02A2.6-like [Corticium candelabrum]